MFRTVWDDEKGKFIVLEPKTQRNMRMFDKLGFTAMETADILISIKEGSL